MLEPGFYISRRRFEEIVTEAMEEIPEALWGVIDNLVVTVEEWPSRRQIESVGLPPGNTLFGLYEGVPLTKRTTHYGLTPPDKITIFRGPILQFCPPDEDAIRTQIRRTVLHEIAHHFGISDERLIELGAY
ncbi:MAG: metallopeptidase family protein [Caldilinea sp.]